MAKKYWWEEDEKQSDNQAGGKSNSQAGKKYWWDDGTIAKTIGNNVASRLNDLLSKHNTYTTDYQNRYSGRKGNYDDAYVSDSADWLEKVKTQKSDFDSEYDSILSYIDQYKGYLDEGWVLDVKTNLLKAKSDQNRILNASINDNMYWSKWETEDDYNKDVATAKDYEAKKTSDINGLTIELEQLKLVADEFGQVRNQYNSAMYVNPGAYTQEQRDDITARYNTFVNQYGSPEDFDSMLNEKKLFLADAKRIQEGITLSGVINNDDFMANSGYVSTEYGDGLSWDKVFNNQYGLGYEDLTYEYINGAENGMRSEIINKAIAYNADNSLDSARKYTIYDKMTEDEISIYNYYYAKDGKEAAQKYLDNLQYTLNAREATDMFSGMEDKTLLELAFGVAAGLDQFESGMKGLVNAIKGDDAYKAPSSIQMASGMVREDLADDGPNLPKWLGGASIGQAGYDFITTTSNMLPSILTSTVANVVAPGSGAALGTALLGSSAGGNAYQEMINLGYDKGQAGAYAVLVGASEALLQYALGGISSLSGGSKAGIFQSVAGKWLPHVDNAFARVAIKMGSNMLDEGLEEGLQEILTPWFKNLTLQTNEKVNWSEVAYSSLLGALTAGFMEGPTTIAGEVKNYKTGKALQAKDISAQRIAEIGKTFSADTVAYQLAGRVNENTGAYTMGRLLNEIGATLTTQNVNEITTELMKMGMDSETAKKNAEALAYVVEGGQLSSKQIAIIEANDVLASVARSTLIDANTTWNQRSKGYNDMLKALAEEVASPKTTKAKQAEQGKENAPASDTVDGQAEIATESHAEADTVDTRPAKVSGIADVKKRTIKLEDGSEVNVKDADLSPDDGVRIETIASIDGISTEDANFVLNTLRTNASAGAQLDSIGAKEVYKYGFYGFSQDHIAKHSSFAKFLTEDQRQAIYEVGQKARQKQIESASPKATTKQRGIYFDHGGGNVVAFKDADKSILSEKKRSAGVQAAVILNKLGIGGDIYFFESYRNSEGKLVYKNSKGIEVKAPNGLFSESDGSIHIDLNAGVKGDGLVLFTLAHELTHFIEKWSPKKYKVLADFLIENYEKDQSMDQLVLAKQKNLSDMRGEVVSYDEAYSEVIADSMEAMLADGNVMEKIMELKAKDNDLVMKIKQFFDNLLAKIRNAYKGLTPDSAEGKAVLKMTDSIERIQQLFAEALVEASDNFQTAEVKENTTEDGGVMYSLKYDDAIDQLHAGTLDRTMNTHLKVLDNTPQVYIDKAGAKDLKIIMGWDIAYLAMNKSGDLLGNYHSLGPEVMKAIPQALQDPLYIVKQDNGRIIAITEVVVKGNRSTLVSIELDAFKSTTQDGESESENYNLIVTIFDAKANYLQKLMNNGEIVHNKNNEDPAHFILRLKSLNKALPNDDRAKSSNKDIAQDVDDVNNESAEAMDLEVDEKTESVAPAILKSERTWTESDYVQERDQAAKEIAKAIGVSEKKAKAYIDSVNSIAKMIAEDRVRLDYFSSPGRSSFVGNVEYGGSFDFSTLCKKRRLLTGTFTAIQKALPNTALTADEILDIRNRMKEAGLEVSCGLCYVEGSRANMGQFAKEFLKLYKQYYPDAWQPNMADVNTPDGIEWVRINHPEAYEQYEYFWNHYGTLKPGDKNLFASQQKPKLYQLHTEYKGEVLEKFNNDDNVEEKNLNGGIRLQSFSDFEIVHLIDTMQIIMDMSRVGLAGQAYTKVPDFAWALGDTGLKINLSLIAKGVDENGKLIFDDVEGMPIADAMKLRDRYSKNVGTILVAFNDEQLLAAMADERVDFIIPFHRSQWKKAQYEAMGLPAKTKDYTYMQNEKFIKPQYHEYRGRMVKDKATNYMPNEYWDFSKSGKENAEAYLEMCARNNKRPKFYKLLQNNGDGSYSLKADGSTDGYWKLLIDFKMYDNEGNGSPQMPVKPEFNMDEAQRMLNEYHGGHINFPVAKGIVDEFVEEYKDNHKGALYSDRYQDRADESVSNRSLLANAFEGLAQNDIEKNKIQEYKGKIDLINAEEQKLSELNAQIKELSFANGPRDTKKIRSLQFEARQTANRINTLDKVLLRLEASKPLQNVLDREKKKAYQKAEQRGKEALDAYKERAAKTQRELLEKWQDSRKKGIDSREKTAMKHKIQRVVGELNQLLLNGDKTRHVPENLKKAVADALSLVNMDTVGAEERAAKYAALIAKETDPDKIDAYTVTMENILRQGEKMGQRLKDLRDAYEEISESDDPDIANAYDHVIAGSLKELAQSIGNTSLRNMTIEQLQDVYDMYKMVLTRVRDANKSFMNDKKEAVSSLASRVVGEVKRVGGEHKDRAAFLDFAKKFGWDNLKPVYAFEHLGSATLTEAFNNVRAGEDVWAVDVTEARKYYLDKSKKYGYDSWDFEKKHRFESASEIEFELTLDQILSLYAYSKREQSLDHLRLGGFVFDSNIETYKEKGSKLIKYKVNTADAHQITPEILANITGLLTNEQKAFVDEMQDYLSTVIGAKGNDVTMQMYGVKLFKEKFYFPLKTAQQFMFEQNEVAGEVKIKNSGFTNKTKPKANNSVILRNFMDVWAGHVNDMSMYHAFVLPLEDFNRIFNYNSPKKEGQPPVSVKGTIQNAYSPAAVNYVRQLITDLNGGARTDSTTGFINKMMGRFKKGSVFASLSVVVQQPSAVARAVALVDTKYFIGPKVDHKRHKALWDEVKQYAPVAIIKEMGYFDTNMGKSTQDFILSKEYSGFKEKMKALVTDSNYRDEVLSKAPALADELAWCSIWEAVKRETQAKNPNMDVKSEAFLKIAGERFTEVITKTQVYDSVLSRSGMMRSKDTGMKMATAFMAEPTTSINMIADALLQGKRGHKKYARAAIGAVVASQILNSILVSFVYAGRDDDEDETYMEKYIGTLTGEIFDSLNPATYIPFIKDIVSIMQGYDVERSDMAVVSDLWKAWENLKKDNISPYRKVEGFAGSIAQIFGLPVKNIMRDARGIYQTIMSFVNGQQTTGAGIGYAVKSAFPEWLGGGDVSKQDQLYEAYLSGDAKQISRVQGRFADQSAVNTAMRSAIKDHFESGDIDRDTAVQYLVEYGGMEEHKAYWRIEEWEYESNSDDEFGQYNDFYTAVQTGKNLKAVIKEYTDHGVDAETLSGRITNHFKPLYKEMSNTERAAIKGYLLNAYQLLGYNRYEKSKDIDAWLKE